MLCGQAFSGVLSNVIILNLNKNITSENIKIIGDKLLTINQKFYEANVNNNFSILDKYDAELLKKIYSTPHQTLKNKSIWGLGIVTGNNKKYIMKNSSTGEKIYSGKNIQKNKITDTDNYINYDRQNFQQTAPESIYRAEEKLVYKFISKKPVFAYDSQKRLFLNSANILIPKLDNYSIQETLIFLNSVLFLYIYKKKFNELKILKGNLMELPFPKFDHTKYKQLTDNIIFEIFNLSEEEIAYIKQEAGNDI